MRVKKPAVIDKNGTILYNFGMKRKYEIVVLSKGAFARTLRIYSPKHADRAVIMHDGQNVFYDSDASFGKSWRMFDALKNNRIKNTAVIGIDSVGATRDTDYNPFESELGEYGMKQFGGGADKYCEFISETVIPYLDKRFGYKFYGMLGSSFGATATLYFATKNNDRLKAYGMFSTPLFVSPNAFDKLFETCAFDVGAMYRVYVGGNETVEAGKHSELVPDLFVDDAHTVVKTLRKKGASDIRLRLENKSVHDEIAWRTPAEEFFSDFSKL